jgi:hypothetical protein
VSTQRIHEADVIAIRHIDTIGLLKLRSERPAEGTSTARRKTHGDSPPTDRPRLEPSSLAAQTHRAHAGRSRVGTLGLGLLLGFAIGQLAPVTQSAPLAALPIAGAAAAPVIAPAPAVVTKTPEVGQSPPPVEPSHAAARHHH